MTATDRLDPVRTALAFDFGRRRIGVACGNAPTASGEPVAVIESRDETDRFRRIEALIRDWKPDVLVVGRPLHPDGRSHEMTRACERFSRQLAGRFGLPVALTDERYSSVDAESRSSASGRSVGLDAEAAAIILRQYWTERSAVGARETDAG